MTAPDIFSASFASDPYPQYRVMRDAYPLYRHPAANAYILSRHADVCAALRDERFTTRSYAAQIEPLLGVTLVQREGRDHARERRLLAAPFRGDRFEPMFAASIAAVADDLIDGFRRNGEVELIGEFVTSFAVGALAVVVGLPPADVDRFRSWYSALLRFCVNLVGDPEVHLAGLAARDALEAYLRPLVAARRLAPGPGLLSLLAGAEIDGQRLSNDAIVRSAMLMVFAGGETVEKTLATFIRNLIAHPDQLAALRADRSLMDRALAESLRYTAPTHMVPRRTNAEVAVSDGVIPAEADVLCFLGAANRDERRFTDPDRFDMFRADADATRAFSSLADHAAFGLGRHFCLGAMMAKIEVGIAVDRLLEAMPGLRFAAGTPRRGPVSTRPAAPRAALRAETTYAGGRMLLGCSTTIRAPTRTVFACVDEPDHIVGWVGGAVEHAYLNQRDPATAVGQRFRQRLRQGRSVRTVHGEIIAWEPTNHFGLRIPTSSYTSEAHFHITADGPDRSRVDYSIEVALHSTIAKILRSLLRLPLRLFVRRQIASLKAYAEALYARQGAHV